MIVHLISPMKADWVADYLNNSVINVWLVDYEGLDVMLSQNGHSIVGNRIYDQSGHSFLQINEHC